MKNPLTGTVSVAIQQLEGVRDSLPPVSIEDPDWLTAEDIKRDSKMLVEALEDAVCSAADLAGIAANVKMDTKEFREAFADLISDLFHPVTAEVERQRDMLPRWDENAEHLLSWEQTV